MHPGNLLNDGFDVLDVLTAHLMCFMFPEMKTKTVIKRVNAIAARRSVHNVHTAV